MKPQFSPSLIGMSLVILTSIVVHLVLHFSFFRQGGERPKNEVKQEIDGRAPGRAGDSVPNAEWILTERQRIKKEILESCDRAYLKSDEESLALLKKKLDISREAKREFKALQDEAEPKTPAIDSQFIAELDKMYINTLFLEKMLRLYFLGHDYDMMDEKNINMLYEILPSRKPQ